ncbi:hypothetical protein NXS08_05675 [Gleimia sp. 6138-11-ORH1]|uniref:hypothetical protein n=1 Tax=Gleimia sp. 6138-11-ORH1 TaxID=2973937 RepID=UPI002166C402|nr:hypothetical protein [Gleimia sp. 6138-11-ORH1]MCS4484959.1 hypothetical protein [Gleimia sp. 6138-11-ORH1]
MINLEIGTSKMKLKKLVSLMAVIGLATLGLTGCFGGANHAELQKSVTESSGEVSDVEIHTHSDENENLVMIVKLKSDDISAAELKRVVETVKAEAKPGYRTLSVNFYGREDKKIDVCPLVEAVEIAPEDCVAGIIVLKNPEAK